MRDKRTPDCNLGYYDTFDLLITSKKREKQKDPFCDLHFFQFLQTSKFVVCDVSRTSLGNFFYFPSLLSVLVFLKVKLPNMTDWHTESQRQQPLDILRL